MTSWCKSIAGVRMMAENSKALSYRLLGGGDSNDGE